MGMGETNYFREEFELVGLAQASNIAKPKKCQPSCLPVCNLQHRLNLELGTEALFVPSWSCQERAGTHMLAERSTRPNHRAA